jgi:hypothetical protein
MAKPKKVEAPKQPLIPSVSPDTIPKLKKFVLQRIDDESGISGTGYVAVGVMFPSGHCTMEWTTDVKSIGYYQSIADLEKIHGHAGKTRVVWIEENV